MVRRGLDGLLSRSSTQTRFLGRFSLYSFPSFVRTLLLKILVKTMFLGTLGYLLVLFFQVLNFGILGKLLYFSKSFVASFRLVQVTFCILFNLQSKCMNFYLINMNCVIINMGS